MYKSVFALFSYNKGANRKFLVAYLVSLLYMIVVLVPSELVRIAVETIETGNRQRLAAMPVWCVVTVVSTLVLIYGEKVLLTRAMNDSEKNIQGKLLKHLLNMKKEKFQTLQEGTIVTQITQNVGTAIDSGYYSVYSLLVGILGLIFSFSYMMHLNVVLMVAMVLFNVAVMFLTSAISKKLKKIHQNVVIRNNEGNHLLLDMLDHSVVIRMFDRKGFFAEKFRNNEEGIYRANLKAFALQNGINEMVWGGKKLAEILMIFGIGGYLVCRGEISISIIASFTIVSEPFSKILKMVVDSIFSINKAVPSIQAIGELFDIRELETEPVKALLPGKGRIEFRDVTFAYGDQTILDHVSFTIEPGDKVMVVGENGQGKTTLLNLIAGLYRPDSGSICIDGEDMKNVNLESIAGKYCYIAQRTQIFKGDAYENLALKEQYDREELKGLLEQLRIESVARKEAGTYSEGEKQRLCIGRALHQLQEGKIVLGDEIFANIDKENRKGISELLADLLKNHTVLMVSHDEEYIRFTKKLTVGQGKAVLEKMGVSCNE